MILHYAWRIVSSDGDHNVRRTRLTSARSSWQEYVAHPDTDAQAGSIEAPLVAIPDSNGQRGVTMKLLSKGRPGHVLLEDGREVSGECVAARILDMRDRRDEYRGTFVSTDLSLLGASIREMVVDGVGNFEVDVESATLVASSGVRISELHFIARLIVQ